MADINNPASNSVAGQQPNYTPLPVHPKKPNLIPLLSLLLIVLMLPIAYFFSQQSKSITSNAAPKKCLTIKFVEINPRQIATTVNSSAIGMSALAYDTSNSPIFKAVNYRWGISSNNGIGNLKSKQDLAGFYPLKTGMGDIFVIAKNACSLKGVTGSISVVVNPATPSATTTPSLKKPPAANPFQ